MQLVDGVHRQVEEARCGRLVVEAAAVAALVLAELDAVEVFRRDVGAEEGAVALRLITVVERGLAAGAPVAVRPARFSLPKVLIEIPPPKRREIALCCLLSGVWIRVPSPCLPRRFSC